MDFLASVVAQEDACPGITGGGGAAAISGTSCRCRTVAGADAVQMSDTVADSFGDHVVSVGASEVLRMLERMSVKRLDIGGIRRALGITYG